MLITGLILAALGLAIVTWVVARKFPLLANIDIEQIAAERQAEVKKRLINEKLKRNFLLVWGRLWSWLKPVVTLVAKVFTLLYDKLVNLKAGYDQADKHKNQNLAKRLEILFAEADDWLHKNEVAKAEARYIEIIGLDAKNYKAFLALGELYMDRGNSQEAEETVQHAIKLLSQKKQLQPGENRDLELSKAYFLLGEIAASVNDHLKSLANIKKSLEIEPNSPRYLDKACEICLNLKDGTEALEYCRQLERVNPSNKKLKDIKDKIRDLAKETDKKDLEHSVDEAQD